MGKILQTWIPRIKFILVDIPACITEFFRCLYWSFRNKCPDCKSELVESKDMYVCPVCDKDGIDIRKEWTELKAWWKQ